MEQEPKTVTFAETATGAQGVTVRRGEAAPVDNVEVVTLRIGNICGLVICILVTSKEGLNYSSRRLHIDFLSLYIKAVFLEIYLSPCPRKVREGLILALSAH